jgi:hypothetical protein
MIKMKFQLIQNKKAMTQQQLLATLIMLLLAGVLGAIISSRFPQGLADLEKMSQCENRPGFEAKLISEDEFNEAGCPKGYEVHMNAYDVEKKDAEDNTIKLICCQKE